MKLDVNWSSCIKETVERIEIFNYKNQEHFQEFVKLSDQNNELKALFTQDEEDLEVSANKWLKVVNKMISQSFSKVRIKKGKINPELDCLLQKKEQLKGKLAVSENDDDIGKSIELEDDIEKVSQQISDICSDKNKQMVDDFIGDFDFGNKGFNQVKTWGLKNRLAPKNVIDPPAAKKNSRGDLVTGRKELENLYLDTYTARLTPNEISEDLQELKNLKEYLFSLNKRLAETEKSKVVMHMVMSMNSTNMQVLT